MALRCSLHLECDEAPSTLESAALEPPFGAPFGVVGFGTDEERRKTKTSLGRGK
jgi:hypothetical protein